MFFSAPKNNKLDRLIAVDHSLAIIEFSPDGTILDANENFLKAIGYSLNEIVGKHHSMFLEPAKAALMEYKTFWDNLRRGRVQQSEFKRITKSGKAIWIEASYTPVFSSSGQVTKIIKFATNITERKLRAADHASQIEAINRSQAVIEFTLDGHIVRANENFLKVMGYQEEEILGKHHSMFVEEEYRRSRDYAEFWSRLREGDFFSAEYKRIAKGGREVWIHGSYYPIMDADGAPYKVVKYAIDITERILLAQRNERIRKIIEANLGDVNHAISSANAQTSTAASASTQTSANVQAVASAAEEMNASVEEIAQNMHRSRDAVDQMVSQVQVADGATKRLLTATQSMTSIISLIQDIAGQINLLALNATIESARAGEAGKGFAVVASEVKSLAGQTAKATEQIAREIEGVQAISRETVESLDTIQSSIDHVREFVTNVAGAIEEQSAVMRDISSNMQIAAMGVDSVNKSVNEIVQATNIAEEATRKVLEASVTLAA
jgi:methyl-accepting chemotaxis protein